MTTPDPVAQRFAELRARVEEHLNPGESFTAAIWVSRATNRPPAGEIARTELRPQRLLEAAAAEAIGIDEAGTGPDTYAGGRRGVLDGAPGSFAAQLDQQVMKPTEPRVLALTSQRLITLAKTTTPAEPRRSPRSWLAAAAKGVGDLIGNQPATAPLPALVPLWQCPRPAVAAAGEESGRLHLSFADGSTLSLVTPAVLAPPFVAAITHG